MKQEQQLTFEEAMARLELIVGQLERGDAPLETAIELFQEGMMLSQQCSAKLEQVERRVEMLVNEGNGFEKQPFSSQE